MEDRPDTDVPPEVDHSRETSYIAWFGEIVLLVGLAFVLAMGVRTFVVQPFYIPTNSMAPTLHVGDRVLVNKLVYRFTGPQPGEIVVFAEPDGGEADLIKRIIAVGGQTIDIDHGTVTVDGVLIEEDYLGDGMRDDSSLIEPVTVPDGELFVMGDNRSNSSDSRVFGTQPVSAVRGRAFAIYWPPSDTGGL